MHLKRYRVDRLPAGGRLEIRFRSRRLGFERPLGRFLQAAVLAAFTVPMLSLAGCTGTDKSPVDSDEKLIQAALTMLDGQGEPLCVDAKTVGHPLSVFRASASNASRTVAPRTWFAPARFSPPRGLSTTDIYRGGQADDTVHLDQPTNTGPELGERDRLMLDRAASSLSMNEANRSITIWPSWQAGMKARWWLRNRVSRHCTPNYHLSNPVRSNDIGFVTITANHWGTTYAFKRKGADWVVTAQLSNWLY